MFPSQGRLYGKGIFTTIAFRKGELLFWEKHWRRIERDAGVVGIDLSGVSNAGVRSLTVDAIAESGLIDGPVRLTFADETAGPPWNSADLNSERTSLDIIVGEMRPIPSPFCLGVSQYLVNSRSPLAGVKSCSYLENILAIKEAKSRGFNEAVRLNERGRIAGGCMSNIFWLQGEKIFTPSLSTGCLPGTIREFILESVECVEVEAELKEMRTADAIYMTSAGLGIAAVSKLDGKQLTNPPHPITELFSRL